MAKRCAIIGAGPAGCTAAYELQKVGFDMELFEAAPQIGGRPKRTLHRRNRFWCAQRAKQPESLSGKELVG